MSAEGKTRKRMGITAIIGSIFIVASLVWGIYSFVLIQGGNVRYYDPHYEYDQIEYWPYTHDFAGNYGNWFHNLNYTDLLIDEILPDDLLDRLNEPVFYVAPANPGQLWRIESYDQYDGSSWTKSLENTIPLDTNQLIPISAATNQIYDVFFNASAGAEVGAISLPSLFPFIRIIEDSFETYSIVDGQFVLDNPTRLLHYDLETDDYGTLLFSPLIDGLTGEVVMVSYQVTYVTQDLDQVKALAQQSVINNIYTDLSLVEPLSQRVTENISQFVGVGTNAYETAMAVQTYFLSTFTLNITQESLLDRPSGVEVTDWFLERGNGLPIDFATSYSVFMRELGIPARIVSGYVIGETHATLDMRILMVRHMSFWVEVFIPMSGHPNGGEWIQVIPTPLPVYMGGGEDPENTPIPDFELLIWPTNGNYYAAIGTPFGLSAAISVDGVFITTPDTISFYDITDSQVIGTAVIGGSIPPPIANLTYTFPITATVDYHTISAIWENSYFSVMNITQIYAQGTPIPLASEPASIEPPNVILAETHELDINQGLNTTVAFWEDTVHVYGVMTVNGIPVNGSKYPGNRYIQIMWNDTVVGDAFIDEYGYYEYDVYVDPLNLTLMTVGPHAVWSSYAGDWTGEFYRLLPANSTYTSVVTVWGRVGFDFSVAPTSVSPGGTIYYSGAIYFLNGTLLPSGQTVGIFFDAQANTTTLNATGGFDWTYIIPVAQSEGSYVARANWTSPWQYIAGNWSQSFDIEVEAGGTQILLDSLPNPVFIGQSITISGYLQHISNGSGISSQSIDVYWSAGSIILIGSDITAADGYFEVSYIIPAGYEGAVTYWAYFSSPIPALTDSESAHLGTTVKRYDVDITIADSPDPIHLLQTVTIQGLATLPENASSPLSNVLLEIYWANTTHTAGVLIGTTWTNDTGGYVFYYQIPLSHNIETVDIWVSFTSPFTNIANGVSPTETLDIIATGTLITVDSDATSYYLNQTVLISGYLRFSNSTPFPNQRIFIRWTNATDSFIFEKNTDISGYYFFIYNLSASMDTGLVNVHVNWTATSGSYDDADADLAPPILLQKYDLQIVTSIPSQIYVDENIVIQGVLSYAGGTPPLVGELVELAWWNASSQWAFIAYLPTNSTGGFYGEFGAILIEYTINFRLQYIATDPLNNDVLDYFFDVTTVKYAINLEVTVLSDTVMQNGTLTVHAYLYYAHNGTVLSITNVSIIWDNGNGTLLMIGNITTDVTGHGDLYYSGMAYDTIRTGINVYGVYVGTTLRASNESDHIIITLEQWESDLVGLNTPFGFYNLLDTVVVSGSLRYVSPSVPYGNAFVELLVLGVPVDSTTTAIDGTFTLSWTIPSDTPIDDYDLVVRYLAPYPWILGVQEFVPTITITAPGYIFVSFTVSPEAPTPVIILNYLTIAGVVTWDNGSAYANSTVELWWGDPLGTDYFMENVMTNGTGAFTTNFQVLGGTPLGTRQVWAYIPPLGIATSGVSYDFYPRTISIETHSLVITASVDVTTAHLGETIIISGTAHFLNSSALEDYAIEIWWDSILIATRFVDGSGDFSYSHFIPYTDPVGVNSGFVLFNAPTAAFPDISENFADVAVREYINLYMDTQPVPNTYGRGDTIIITGFVVNNGATGAVSVEIRILVNNVSTINSNLTGADGRFSIPLLIPYSQAGGQYNITIESTSLYRDVLSINGMWIVIIVLDSTLDVQVSRASFMPGETFNIQLQLFDQDNNPINGATIEIRLNTTLIGTVFLSDGTSSTVIVAIPTSWSNDGYFVITVGYAGNTYLNGDSDVSAGSIHIFTDVEFNNESPGRVTPGQSFIIEVHLTDPDQNAIADRSVILNIDGITIATLTTDSEGIISYEHPGRDVGLLQFNVTLTSDDVSDVGSGTFEILIQTQGGIILQGTDLIIAGVLLVGAVIAVLAYLYIVKGMFRSVIISRGIDIPTKLRNIKKLADAGKYGASITLAYRTFEQMCGSKMGSERTHSETAREYLDRVMQSIPLDGPTVEQFVQTYEEARFSHHEMTRERYEAALRIFTDIYPRIDTSSLME